MNVNLELAYRCQMLPENILSSRSNCERELLKAGWKQDVLASDLDGAIAWAKSQKLVARQEKQRKKRANKKEFLKGNDAVEAMFASVGVAPSDIIKKELA